jgi:hypothetical protein
MMYGGLDAGLAELLEELIAGGPVDASAHVRDDRVKGLALRVREAVMGRRRDDEPHAKGLEGPADVDVVVGVVVDPQDCRSLCLLDRLRQRLGTCDTPAERGMTLLVR